MEVYRPKVSIILLNYNSYKDSIECFESLKKISYENYNVIIVDNASPDASMDKLLAYMKDNEIEYIFFNTPKNAMNNIASNLKVSLIQSTYNGGYGHGNNIGIRYALKNDADYVLILNNDTIVDPYFLEPMIKICEEDKNIGIASGKIYYYDRPDTIWYNGGKFYPLIAKVKHFNFNEKDIGQTPKEPITFITGCMWLVPKRTFHDIGYINEEYFMYVEDLEFCQRVLAKGYKLNIIDKSHIFHKVGNSSGGGDFTVLSAYFLAKNKLNFIFSEHYPLKKSKAVFFILLEPLRLIKNKQKLSVVFSYINGIFDYFTQKDKNKWK